MDEFKSTYDNIKRKKGELAEQKTSGIRKAIINVLGEERRAVKVFDDSTGESFHVRLDERKTKCAPSVALIIQALEAMEVPTATDFITRLNDVCVKTTKSVKLTRHTRGDFMDPASNEIKDLLLGYRNAQRRREVIRKELKLLRDAFRPQEDRMTEALHAAGKDVEEGKCDDGTPFLICRKINRKRKRVPKTAVMGKVESVFDEIKSRGAQLSTEQMAQMIYNAINPVHEEATVVIK